MEENMKIVEYDKYCPKCKHADLDVSESPCYECLEHPARQYSRKPLNFEEDESKKEEC